jgi:uncharacterized protein (TIGR00369 family)
VQFSNIPDSPEAFNQMGQDCLPSLLGLKIISAEPEQIVSELAVRPELFAPNGYLHAASIIALADTSCGYGAILNLPAGASGFTTIELKSNFTGTARDGLIECLAQPLHLGRTTQLWDAVVRIANTDKNIAQFRCTQMILWPR